MSAPDIAALTKDTIVPFLSDLFTRRANEEYLGEPVTIGEHMLQGAAMAEDAKASEEIIVAALLHDIGHFTSDLGTVEENDKIDRLHEEAGAQVLERFFPEIVVDCVRYHVAAKRYLCAVKPEYFDRLSEASIKSLELQGGPMSDAEVASFEAIPHHKQIVQVRYLDEAAKVIGMETPDFAHFAPMVQRVVDRASA